MSTIKKGITIWAFENGTTGQLDLMDTMLKAKKVGFDALELSFYEKGQVSLESNLNELKTIKQNAKKANIALSSLSTLLLNEVSLTANENEEQIYAYKLVEKMLETAAQLEIPTISISPGKVSAEVSYKVAYERAFDKAQKLGEVAKTLGVKLCLENVWQGFLQSPLEFNQFVVDIANPYVGVCFDIGNALLLGYPQHWVEIMEDRIYKIHLDDARKRRGRFFEFVELGKGEVDWPLMMKVLRQIGYDSYATVEAFYNSSKDEMQQLQGISENLQEIIGRMD